MWFLSLTSICIFCYSLLFFFEFWVLIFKNFIRVWLIYNIVLPSAVQPSESITHIRISTLFEILFPFRSLKER